MDYQLQRVVEKFPSAYNSQATEYANYRYDGEVRSFCENEVLTAKSPLRVAKCVVVGDIAVGKTCLVNRFGYNVFSNNYKATIGVDFDVQKFKILDTPFTLQIWDTAGQERFKCITSTYYRGAHVAVIVFDLSNVRTLSSVKKWLNDVMASNARAQPLLFLVGSKRDLLTPSVLNIVETEAIKVAKEIKAEYWSVSAQTGQDVEELFTRIAVLSFEEMIWREIETIEAEKKAIENGKPAVQYSEVIVKLKKPKKARKKCFSLKCFRK